MDPWKISTVALGTLSATLVVALAVVWSSSPPAPAPQVDLEEHAATSSSPAGATEIIVPEAAPAVPLAPVQAEPESTSAQLSSGATSSAPAWVSDPAAPLPDDVMERARDQMREAFRERREERRLDVRDEIDAFLDEQGFDSATADKVNAVFDDYTSKMEGLREQVRSGEVDRMEARGQFRSQREAMEAELDATLGEEASAKLQERLPGPGRGRGGGPGIGGRGGRGL